MSDEKIRRPILNNESSGEEFKKFVRKLSTTKTDFVTEGNFQRSLQKIEKKTEKVKKWIKETKTELASLPSNPTTFDEILNIITPDRVQKVKEKIIWLREIQDRKGELSLTKTISEQQKFQKRIWATTIMLERCRKELEKLEIRLKQKSSFCCLDV